MRIFKIGERVSAFIKHADEMTVAGERARPTNAGGAPFQDRLL